MTDPADLALRDVHLPGEIPFWPPAPGWWIMAALIIGTATLGWWLYRRNTIWKYSAARLARLELQTILTVYATEKNPLALLTNLSILMRRLSISLFPRTEVASLTGQSWLEFLDKQTTRNDFSAGAGRLLSEAPYRREVSIEEADQVLQHCQAWISTVTSAKPR